MDPNYIYICFGLSVIGIFTFRPDLLILQKSFRVVAVICIFEFLVGVTLHFIQPGHSAAGALLAPLPTLGYFRLCLKAFHNIVSREPIDVAYNWNPGLFKDRLFALAFVFGGFFIFGVAMFGADELGKVGW